jgi:hypothetical protein
MKFSYRNQAFYKINPEPIQDLISNPVSYLAKRDIRCPFYIKIFNIINWFHDRYHNAHPSHATIAKYARCHINTVKNVINLLVEDGILVTFYRHMSSCIYKISSYFSIPTVRAALSKWIPSFKYLSLAIFYSFSNISNIEKFHTDKLSTITKRREHSYVTDSPPFITDIKKSDIYTVIDKRYNVENSKIPKSYKFLDKGEVVMKIYDYRRTHSEIKAIKVKGLPLTIWGKVSLAAYPPEAIIHATSKLSNITNRDTAFRYFTKIAENYCLKGNITPNHSYVKELFEQFNEQPLNALMVDWTLPLPTEAYSEPNFFENPTKSFQKGERVSLRPQFVSYWRPPREPKENWETSEVLDGVQKLAKLMGEEAAVGFFNRNKRNMTIEEVPLAPNTNQDDDSQSIIGEIV